MSVWDLEKVAVILRTGSTPFAVNTKIKAVKHETGSR
jgi:hypothetical protein